MSIKRLAVLGLLGLAGCAAPQAAPAPAAMAVVDQTVARQQSEDLAVYRRQIFALDRSFSAGARQEAERRLAEMDAKVGTMSAAQFALDLAAIHRLADNGHTMTFTQRWTALFNRLPVDFLYLADGLFLAKTGQRVRGIDGRRVEEIREVFSQYVSGSAAFQDAQFHNFVASPQLLHAAGLADRADAVTLMLDESGLLPVRAAPASMAAVSAMADVIPSSPLLSLGAPHGVARPLYLEEPDRGYFLDLMPEQDAAYLAIRQNYDDESGQSLADFTVAAAAQLAASPVGTLILDERFNLGGDLNLTRDLMQTLPSLIKEDGHIYALIGGRTFSAGISSIGYLKQAGGDRVTLIGTPIGDRLDFWSEGEPVTLPHSGLMFLFATERHRYDAPCTTSECHGSIVRHPIRLDDLDPDIVVETRYVDFAAGRDPLMDAVWEAVG